MKFELFTRVALKEDLANYKLCRGDVATIVEHHPVKNGEDGYSLEVFNAVGETISVITVAESQIEPLMSNEVLHVRILESA
ncbi:DUF4926 domain-containing protein [Crocosphaera watsonii WH 8501]|uniref:DUF4926 domain-containing protein n=6 Tax=Crocosphaera watsonii TaxID=263511 RepID=Q4BUV3_CROWT|nr:MULTISPECIES: DUF4926 domain-containing protein [Crocosphaera]EAM47677.1 hypothetical protein CwatDRAFT_0434 [Crocosphaera watsonii WH 8501]EHJ09957.1 hypothetical protein CWATWH0003_5283 [Crocosphaera watsonii WH 0003]MCH2247119.1 DUF4926 domain-containing protein [Crocosphaera sp.]NQZ62073.1 DUF4926 domain-containing protein [Crocosphaera sp.]CCQ53380.1 FIG00568228: hypothetical protein [Crocosphaera watsonii WH 8502]